MTNRLIAWSVPYIAAAALALTGMQVFGATATINPSQDTTLAEELPDNSSGACDSIFSGMIDDPVGGTGARRALIQFDIAGQIPPGSTITSVTLSMAVTRGSNHVDSTFDLHPVTVAWVEGVDGCGARGGGQGEPSTGGATWTTMNSSYNATSSGDTLINDTAPVWSSTAAMVSDVQSWLDSPATNRGWMVIGDETNTTTTRRFDSREGASPPQLVVVFDLDPNIPVNACCETDGSCSLTTVTPDTCGGTVLPGVESCEPNQCQQPTGACCNVDNTCSDEDRGVCEGAGGTFVGGNCNQADCGLTPFVEALPIPPILQPTGTRADGVPQYTVSVEEAVQSVHPNLPDTTVWTYNGAWPAATIVATKDEPIEVTYVNNLPTGGGNRGSNILEVDTCAHGPNDWGDSKRIVTHLHGAHLPARFDGQPEYTILPGESDVYQYPNDQDAATVWYHDHALGITRLNVYGGMAGFYLIRDNEDTLGLGNQDNAFNLPSLGNEIGLAIQDRTFDADGSLFYNAQLEDAFKGEYAVVNGKVNPYLEVKQGKYRFRILNGSQSREYDLRLENITSPDTDGHPSFVLIGTDLGLIDAPIVLPDNHIGLQGPAERMDVVIDFAAYPIGTEIIMRNDDPTLPLLPNIMKFIVVETPQGETAHTDPLPATLRAVTPMDENSEDVTRYFRLQKYPGQACKDGSGRSVNEWLIESLDGPCEPDGQGGCNNITGKHWDDLTEFPILGEREIWEFFNDTNSYHPMHVHLVRFQILSKTGPNGDIPLEPWEENTWKDIVHIPPNSTARIIMDFDDYAGRFPSHCHLLDHEDHEMMRQFQAINDPANCNNDGICDVGEDCGGGLQGSCADCGQVSGAFCGNGLCEAGDGENCATCAEDCAGKQKGSAANQFCCGYDDGQVTNPIGCGADASDNRCIDSSSNVFCRVTERLSACCGDAMCEGQEDVQGSTYCQVDCDPGAACVPTEPGTEVTCDDGQDNDCDSLIDAADPDCDVCAPTGVSEDICNGVDDNCNEQIDELWSSSPTSCGVGVCASNGDTTCNGGVEGDTCTPGTPGVEGPFGDASCNDSLDNDCDGLTDANDPDCEEQQGVVCVDITVKGDCNNEPTCEWIGKKNGSCQEIVQCTPDENPEVSCTDGIDNDCNGATDCDDSNCNGDPACQTTCNNDGVCDPGEDCLGCVNDCAGVTGGKPANRYCCGNGVQESPEGDGSICGGNY